MEDVGLVETLMDEIARLNRKIAKLEGELDSLQRQMQEARSDLILEKSLRRNRP
tara:strand:+ start:209 stop:370 length:162 start_codon:yes stop_codon:yes gene_type:complete